MSDLTTYVGIDAHKEFLHVAISHPGENEEKPVRIRNLKSEVHKLARKILKEAKGPVSSCYEAGHYLVTLGQASERLRLMEDRLEEVSHQEPYARPVGWLRCMRGIDTVSAMTIVSELHGFQRFRSPRHLMGYLGLTPSEHSSGSKTQRGGITKCGNDHVRRILIEAAWQYRLQGKRSQMHHRRQEGQPGWAIAVANKAHCRLHKRYYHLLLKGKPSNKVVVAIARELTGFIWAILKQEQGKDDLASSNHDPKQSN